MSTKAGKIVRGTARRDVIVVRGAGSTVSGLAGDDLICATRRARISGGPGNDVIYGSAWPDMLDGSTGDDVILAGSANDAVFGGAGDDQIAGGPGDDTVTTGTGSDRVDGGSGNDRIIADRADVVTGRAGDSVWGNPLPVAPPPTGAALLVPGTPDPAAPPSPAPALPPMPVFTQAPTPTAPAVPADSSPAPTPSPADVDAPSPVTGLFAQLVDGRVVLVWEPSSDDVGVSHYVVWRSIDPYFLASAEAALLRVPIGATAATTFEHTPSGPTNYYFVTAMDAAGNASATDQVTAVVTGGEAIRPSPPNRVRISSTSTAITLNWTYCDVYVSDRWLQCFFQSPSQLARDVQVSRFVVERSTSASFPEGAGTEVVVVQAASTFVDVPPDPQATFYYRVRAMNAAGQQSEPTQVRGASLRGDLSPPTAPPYAASSTVKTDWEIWAVISWGHSTDDVWVSHYVVQRSLTPDFSGEHIDEQTVDFNGLFSARIFYKYNVNGPVYYYRVIAVDSSGKRSDPVDAPEGSS